MSGQFESFEQAFRGNVNGCRRTCECGVVFFDTHNVGYDWDEGEFEELRAMESTGKAKGLPHAVGLVEFEGRYYVDGCSCWHERAKTIIGFIVNHDYAIADFLRREKQRKTAEAERSPVV